MTQCPCGSGHDFDACCGPYIAGDKPAPTAEALMRSRYSAYTMGNVAYLQSTLAEAVPDDEQLSEEEIKAVTWQGLEIRATEGGGENDNTGTVEFVARYKAQGEQHVFHERSRFGREDGRWVYIDGVINPKSAPVTSTKVGRNEPCPCGSGKKYKKCCGA